MARKRRTPEEPRLLEVEWHVAAGAVAPGERDLVLKRLPNLSRAVRDFPVSTVHVEVSRDPRRGGYGVAVHLPLPQRGLFAAEWARDLSAAGRRAMDKVAAQAATYRAMLRRHERRSRRREPSAGAPAGDGGATLALERAALESLRPRIARIVRKEILHDASLAGLPRSAIPVPDVVDEAMVWTQERLQRRPAWLTPEQFLWRSVLQHLDEAREAALRGRDAELEEERVEAAHAEPNPELDMEWEEAEDLIFGDGEPLPFDRDEASRSGSDPAEILDREAAQRAVSDALRDLPDGQRRAILLEALEGYDAREVAYVLSVSEDRVRADLDEARAALRRRLREYAPTPRRPAAARA